MMTCSECNLKVIKIANDGREYTTCLTRFRTGFDCPRWASSGMTVQL